MPLQFLFDPRETLPGSIGTNPGGSGPTPIPPGGIVAAVMPYFISTTETYQIPLNRQGLYTIPIDVEGVIDVDGDLVEVPPV